MFSQQILNAMQAHPYFNPIRSAESSRARAHWATDVCGDCLCAHWADDACGDLCCSSLIGGFIWTVELLFVVELAFGRFCPFLL